MLLNFFNRVSAQSGFAAVLLLLVLIVSPRPAFSQPAPVAQAPVVQEINRAETARLLEWLGVLPAVRQMPQVAELSLRAQLLDVASADTLQPLQDSIQQHYAATAEMQAAVVDFVAARIDPRLLSRASGILQQPLPLMMRNSAAVMQQSAALADMTEYHRKLAMQPTVNARRELVAEIDKVMRVSLLAVQIQTGVDDAVNRRLAAAAVVPPVMADLVREKLAAREQFMQQRVADLLLYVYRDSRASELREFVVLMRDDSIQKLLDLSQQAIEMVLRQ